MNVPVILVHPMWFDGRYWDPVIRLLPHDVRPLAVDLPGFGSTPGPFTASRAISAIRSAEKEIGDPAHLVGLSLGARVALAAAAADSTRVRSLVLLGIGGDVSLVGTFFQRVVLRFAGRGVAQRMGGQTMPEPNRQAVAAQRDMPLTANAQLVKVPTLVVEGGADAEFRDSCRRAAELIDDSRLVVVPDAEHMWPRERPREFVDLLLDWCGP